jgi:hypothetical protein
MTRWEPRRSLAIGLGVGVGVAVAATALLPLSHSVTGGLRPYIPIRQLAATLGIPALLAVIALAVPQRVRPSEATDHDPRRCGVARCVGRRGS